MVIKAAAVSDYRVAQKGARIVVGFAAETGEVVQRAYHKLMAKQLDLIVANDVSQAGAGFACDINPMILIDPADRVEELPLLPKRQVARRILDRLVGIRQQSG